MRQKFDDSTEQENIDENAGDAEREVAVTIGVEITKRFPQDPAEDHNSGKSEENQASASTSDSTEALSDATI